MSRWKFCLLKLFHFAKRIKRVSTNAGTFLFLHGRERESQLSNNYVVSWPVYLVNTLHLSAQCKVFWGTQEFRVPALRRAKTHWLGFWFIKLKPGVLGSQGIIFGNHEKLYSFGHFTGLGHFSSTSVTWFTSN